MTVRCAVASRGRDDPIAGTASTVRPFLLVENPGPWGIDAVRDNRLPGPVKQALRARAAAEGVRVLLIRRFHRRAPREGFHVFAAYADPHRPWLERGVLDREADLLDLDLAALGAGRSPALSFYDDTLFCVCTHGRHDACCAERGRPVAAALSEAYPDTAWEVSHIGGDRFAGNMLVLPHGLYYGRLDAVSAQTVAGATRAGELELDKLRGRSGFSMPVQAAEIAVRRHLELTSINGLTLLDQRRNGHTTTAVFDTAGAGTYLVRVETTTAGSHQLTCRATRDNPIPHHRIVELRRDGIVRDG